MNLSFFLATFFLFITSALAVSCDSCESLTYNETEAGFEIYSTFNFKNELVVHLVKLIDESEDSNLCLEARIDLCWVH